MPDPAPLSALREWRDHFRNPTVWIGCLGVAVLVALIGPFGTQGSLTLPLRLLYWGAVVPSCYAIGAWTGFVLAPRLAMRLPAPAVALVCGIVDGLLILGFITALNAALFGLSLPLRDMPQTLVLFVAIAMIVSYLIGLLPASGASAAPREPALLDRLPIEKRGGVLALSSEDHYTRIRTTKGEEMVLIRLADAIREAAPTPGLRVHRSHWVALSAVETARREGDRAILTLAGGIEVPVSRANMPAIREAGLLPR